MDELNEKITKEELEDVAGGVKVTPYYCEKCRCGVMPETTEINSSGHRIHTKCGGPIRPTVYDRTI